MPRYINVINDVSQRNCGGVQELCLTNCDIWQTASQVIHPCFFPVCDGYLHNELSRRRFNSLPLVLSAVEHCYQERMSTSLRRVYAQTYVYTVTDSFPRSYRNARTHKLSHMFSHKRVNITFKFHMKYSYKQFYNIRWLYYIIPRVVVVV